MSVYPNTECHAVLALLSEGYPPLEGRSPTRYSPVCHSTCPLRDFRVRLACIRHAASVDSEPGSNSQVKFVRLRASRFGETRVPPHREALRTKLVQPSKPDDSALRISNGRPVIGQGFLPATSKSRGSPKQPANQFTSSVRPP